MCEEILVDKIICDEYFRISNYDKNIEISNIIIPEKSTVSGTVEIAVIECTPIINIAENSICARIELFIQKELLISTPDFREIPLEFGFRVTKTVCFKECTPSKLCEIDPHLLHGLECRVIDISKLKDLVTLYPSSETTSASFDELLKIKLHLMLVQKRRISVPVCSPCPPCPPKPVCYPVSVCPPQTSLSCCCSSYLSYQRR